MNLKPELEKLADVLAEKKIDIMIGDYNVIENEEIDELDIVGVPVMYFIKKGSKELIKLPNELRSAEKLLEFISTEGVSAKIVVSDFTEALAAKAKAALESEAESLESETPAEEVTKETLGSAQPGAAEKEVL